MNIPVCCSKCARRLIPEVAIVAVVAAATLCRAQGVITTIAGNGTIGFSGDSGPGTSAALGLPNSVAVDGAGNVYFADALNRRVRKVDAAGTITTVAGTGFPISGGDGGPATSAGLALTTTFASGVAVDSAGNLYIADTNGGRIRKVSTSGTITTVAGNGNIFGFSGDGGSATSAQINSPTGIAVDSDGNLYIADTGNGRIRKVSTAGTITTVAGSGNGLFSGDGGPATSAHLANPVGVAVDNSGNIYIADTGNNRVRKVNAAGTITTVAGDGEFGFCGAGGGAATRTGVGGTQGVAVDSAGNLYISDPQGCIQKADLAGTIARFAGGGSNIPGDGGPPLSAGLATPAGIALDSSGNVYFADSTAGRIRKVTGASAPPAGAPVIFSGGVINAASFDKLAGVGITPGSIVAIFGSGFSTTTTVASTIPLPTTIAGTRVLMNGVPAPLLAVTPGQINAVVPWELSGVVNVQVVVNGVTSASEQTSIGGRPGIFTALSSGIGPGVITHIDGTLVSPSSPAAASEFLVVYCTGLGLVTNRPATGFPASASPLSATVVQATATIANINAPVIFSGLTPGFVGLYQVNLQVPANIQVPANNPNGNVVPLVISISAAQSNIVDLAVR